jgi:dUTPase
MKLGSVFGDGAEGIAVRVAFGAALYARADSGTQQLAEIVAVVLGLLDSDIRGHAGRLMTVG